MKRIASKIFLVALMASIVTPVYADKSTTKAVIGLTALAALSSGYGKTASGYKFNMYRGTFWISIAGLAGLGIAKIIESLNK